jgi:hypothetical protein
VARSFTKLLSHFCVVGDEWLGRGGSWLHQFYVQDKAARCVGSRGTEPCRAQGSRRDVGSDAARSIDRVQVMDL